MQLCVAGAHGLMTSSTSSLDTGRLPAPPHTPVPAAAHMPPRAAERGQCARRDLGAQHIVLVRDGAPRAFAQGCADHAAARAVRGARARLSCEAIFAGARSPRRHATSRSTAARASPTRRALVTWRRALAASLSPAHSRRRLAMERDLRAVQQASVQVYLGWLREAAVGLQLRMQEPAPAAAAAPSSAASAAAAPPSSVAPASPA